MLGTLYVAAAALVGVQSWATHHRVPPKPPAVAEIVPEVEEKAPGAVDFFFAGDIALGETFERLPGTGTLADAGYGTPFEAVSELLQQGDHVVANLETPLIAPPGGDWTPSEGTYWSRADLAPKALAESGITAVSLANDHALDFGSEGLLQTTESLDAAGISWFGAGEDARSAARPLFIEAPLGRAGTFRLAVLTANQQGEDSGAVTGLQPRPFDLDALVAQVEELLADDPNLYVVVYPHWGRHYGWQTRTMREAAQALVAAGADLIVGQGSHMMQEVERLGNAWVIYGLGNLVFTSQGQYQKRNGALPYGFVARLRVREAWGRYATSVRLYPLHIDNRVNAYRPRPVTVREIGEVYWQLLWFGYEHDRELKRDLRLRQDPFGRFIELRLDPRPGEGA